MKKPLLILFIILGSIYLLYAGGLYFFQESIIFHPQKLKKEFQFNYGSNCEEIYIKTEDGKLLNGLLFKADTSKGLIFYLHGNAGSLKYWGTVAQTYNDLHYDAFIFDYRGFGKSEGNIKSQDQLYQDNQTLYNEILKRVNEDKIIVLGYSIGTGLAAQLASTNNPKLLILQAPYYNLTDIMKHRFPYVPSSFLKYKFLTNEYLKNCKMPVVIFHGDQDKVIDYRSSLKLKAEFKQGDTLITLNEQGHNGITDNLNYKTELAKILSKH